MPLKVCRLTRFRKQGVRRMTISASGHAKSGIFLATSAIFLNSSCACALWPRAGRHAARWSERR
eukprot:13457673-Alexandrium_andersonii.AAC.1